MTHDPNNPTEIHVDDPVVFTGISLLAGLGGDAGFGENILDRNDDSSTGLVDITSIFENGLNFFGTTYTSLYVNNNGSVTFNSPRSSYTPTVITETSNNPEITPFFADVDTRGGVATASPGGNSTGSNLVYYDFDTANDRFIVTWDDVGYFSNHIDLTNAFQLILTDTGFGDFDIEFRYEHIEWTTGDASGGSGGFGGEPARAGYTAGTGDPLAFFELPASGVEGEILTLDEDQGNTGQTGRWFFTVQSGDFIDAGIPGFFEDDLDAWIMGDPHLLTLDGVPYDFHGAGEFVLLRSTGTSNFEVQARMTPVGETVSVNAAIAVRAADGTAIMIDSTDTDPLTIGGVSTTVADFSSVTVGNDAVFREGNTYTIVFAGADNTVNTGDSRIIVEVRDGRLDLNVSLNTELAGELEGLLGDGDGDPANDIAFADGTALTIPLSYNDLYGRFRDDWRVDADADSLFTYDAGESLEGFYDADFPGEIVSVADFDQADIDAAELTISNAGLTQGTINYENALLDLLLTGDESYVDSAANAEVVLQSAAPAVESTASVTLTGDGDDNVLLGSINDDMLDGQGGDDMILGSFGNDEIFDGLGNNTLQGQGGDDEVIALSGVNVISGGAGSDFLVGGFQADVINGGSGDDVIAGESATSLLGGSDIITGGSGDDIMMGGRGADTFVFATNAGTDIIGEFLLGSVDDGVGDTVTIHGADFQSGVDHIQLQGFTTVNASNVMASVTDSTSGAVFSAEGTVITLFDIAAAEISSDDFMFA